MTKQSSHEAFVDTMFGPSRRRAIPPAASESLERIRLHRILLVVACIGLFGPALVAWSSIIQIPAIGVIATAGCAAALALVVTIAATKTSGDLIRLDAAVLALALVLLGAWAITELYFYPAYGTDEAAFVQYAAQLLMHGHNPYTHNLLPALTQFRVPIQFATYKLNGHVVSMLGYPALSFLIVVPFEALTHGVQAIIIENVLFLAVEMAMVFAFLPKMYRALGVVLVLGLPFLFDYSIGGDIVTMSVPFMLVLAYRWTMIGRKGRLGAPGVLRAVCLGLAMSISQFAWFVAPFVVLGLWNLRATELGTRKGAVVVLRFAAVAGSTFALVNAPFIVWGWKAWLSGVLSPLDQHAIPFGQGLIDATVFLRVGGGNLSYFTYAAVLTLLTLLVFYGAYFSRLWRVAFVLPSIVFFFSTRALSEYFIMMVALWLVSLLSPDDSSELGDATPPPPTRPSLGRHSRPASPRQRLARAAVLATPLVGAVACLVLALVSPAPLHIKLESVQTNGQFKSIWQIRANVTNRSSATLTPHFATDASGYMTTFWNATKGPRTLGPGQSALYTLVAPNVGSMPGVTQPFVLQAVTASPETISSSALYTPEHFDSVISPSYVNRIVPLGHSVTLNVELRSPYGAPVHRRGIRVALGQVIYSQSALIPGEASINGTPEGQSPVIATTDRQGVVTFHIRDSSAQGDNPLYFQAYVSPQNGFPYGYSEVVSVQWSTH